MVKNTKFLSAIALAVMGANAQTAQGMDPNKGLKKVFIPFCQDLPAGEGRVIRIPQNIPNKIMGTQEGQSTPTSISTINTPQEIIQITDITSLPQEAIEHIFSQFCRGSFANIALTCQKFLQSIKNIEDIKSIPLPKELKEVVLNQCQGSFSNVSLVCKDFLRLTNKLTTSLKPKRNWVFDIFQYSPTIQDLLQLFTNGGRTENMENNKTYSGSLLDKGKISYSQTDMIYPVFTNLLTKFKNLTSLDLCYVNISNPTASSVTFFTENSLEKLTNLQFLHISPSSWLGAPINIYSEKPEDTQNRLSIFREQLKKLTNLSILICSGNGNVLTDDLLECLPKLRNLDLSKNQLVTNEGVKKLPGLEYLCLGKNTSISPQTLQKIPHLMFLDIRFNKGYTNEDILGIPNLKILYANCSNLNIKNGFHELKTVESSQTSSLFSKFTNYLFDTRYDRIGDPYETFLLKLEEKACKTVK